MKMRSFDNVYKDKTVLITGHTGFKGSWLSIWLRELGATVIGYALEPASKKDNFVLTGLEEKIIDIRGDIRDKEKLQKVFAKYKPDMVFHLAAQPLVKMSYEQPVYTYEVNVMGTIHVLECIKNTPSVKVGILITTDKCYENKEQVWGYKETDPLGGYDPYSSSKGACEIAISSWRQSFMNPLHFSEHGKAIASVRAGNVIGGGDWAKDRIIPDCIKALEANEAIKIRSPYAVRPWQHVLEPLRGYLLLGQRMLLEPNSYSEAWNFGPLLKSVVTVQEIVDQLIRCYGKGQMLDVSDGKHLHEANMLNLDISKAKFRLDWHPILSLEETVFYTVDWYKNYQRKNVYELCKQQIEDYTEKLASK
ncbi:CDP-glucose 4,6-dehydratase [Sporanaerobium hydrogeniformans]|uniref:CDP-glucose 4,6-dehydratase n=1 Tax=Sporanaerobium hydrogeniformans TaxID=3072179 RepID=A0AC61DE10_9FIRM|nr:CDP-glucose 4,6-dehydratase [Sporanaerobium hydrogeniformans]